MPNWTIPVIECVLDASAIIAIIKNEPGAALATDRLLNGTIVSVNVAEVCQHLLEFGYEPATVIALIDEMHLHISVADRELALLAGTIDRRLLRRRLSLADRFCLAEARRRGVPAVTTDRDWLDIAGDIGVEIELARLA